MLEKMLLQTFYEKRNIFNTFVRYGYLKIYKIHWVSQ